MNKIENSKTDMMSNNNVRYFDCKPPRSERYNFPSMGNKYELPFMERFCKPKPDNQETIANIVEQFTGLLQNVFAVLEQTIQGLLGLLSKEQPATETAPPAAETPATPAPSTPAPSTPETEAPATETPVAEAPKETTETEKPDRNKLDEAKSIDKNGEFLWKPVSDKDGKLAIVLPGNLTGKVKSVKIVDENGKVIAKGDYSGTGNPLKNGEREHYRFGREGSKFPDGSYVLIALENGNFKKIKINDTSERFVR